MASRFIEQRVTTTGSARFLYFAGDHVRLSGQMDYPDTPAPPDGYPVIFIIQHATCTSRRGYEHVSRLGAQSGIAVFRWDKRGTGDSAAGGAGSAILDTLNAYETALSEPNIDRHNAIIFAQNEGSLLLAENYDAFVSIQRPKGILLAGNMLDEKQILTLDVPLHIVMSKNDWNDWHIYADKAVESFQKNRKQTASYFVAPNTNRRLMYHHGGTFHKGAEKSMLEWLQVQCSMSSFV